MIAKEREIKQGINDATVNEPTDELRCNLTNNAIPSMLKDSSQGS